MIFNRQLGETTFARARPSASRDYIEKKEKKKEIARKPGIVIS